LADFSEKKALTGQTQSKCKSDNGKLSQNSHPFYLNDETSGRDLKVLRRRTTI
jgi:hypothetical protein